MNVEKLLLATQGYHELGMFAEAVAELAPLVAAGPAAVGGAERLLDIRRLRLNILTQARRWEEALADARWLCRAAPAHPVGYIQAAFCLHELGRTQAAKETLLNGPASLLREPTYHYNLGCYEANLGNLESAQAYLRVSFRLDANFRELARTDPDLRAVRDCL